MNRAVEWFVGNSVAANLLCLIIVAGGLLTVGNIKKEVFPELELDLITVTVPYPGAAPEDVEEGIAILIEEEIQGIEGIKKLTSASSEGQGVVTVEVETGYDVREVLDEVKNRIDGIDSFPADAERPIIREVTARRQVLDVAVAGNADEATLKRLGERVRDEIAALPGITQVDLVATRPYEISIEVSEEALRRHGLRFDDVARAVRQSAVDLPGGSVKTEGGEILLRAKGRAYRGPEFEDLVLLSRPDGTYLRVGDVARVVDGFAETDEASRFDGTPAVMVQVFRVGEQSALDIAAAVKAYLAGAQARMPEGVRLTVWQDTSRVFQGRMDLLVNNGLAGFALVFIVLTLFLRLGLAFWVSVSIPVSFLGTLWLLPGLDVSINMLSLFAFIVALGIVVDNAIVVGENVYTEQGRLGPGELTFTSSLFSAGEAINVELRGGSLEQLREAAERLKARLAEYPGVFDIADSFRAGKRELTLAIRPEAEALGLTLSDLGRQVRQGFHGEEAQRIQRGRDEVRVMVRYPAGERRSLGDLENARIRTPAGAEVPFGQVALAEHGRGYEAIRRTNRQRAVNVTADVDLARGNPNEIVASLQERVLPELLDA